jgi:hypothetical protein
MKFKVGDIVRAVETVGVSFLKIDRLYKVASVSRRGNYLRVFELDRHNKIHSAALGEYFASRFELAIPDTKLNRVLYSELTSNGRGFLS